MRCPDCNKFVSYGEPSTDNLEVSLNGTEISLSGTLNLPCGDCSTDLAEAEMEDTLDVETLFSDVPEADTVNEDAGETMEYELDGDPDIEAGEEGGGRYAKKYYTVTASGTVRRVVCDSAGEEIESKTKSMDYSLSAKEQASAFNSLV